MRAQYSVLYALTYVVGALVIADQWVYRRIDLRVDQRTSVTVALAVLMVLVGLVQLLTTRSADRARGRAREAEETAAAERARVNADVHAAITERIHAVVVEVIAAQQAVVRGAYGDDILTRLTSADESAHDALESLNRLMAAEAETTSEVAGTPVAVA